MKHRSHLLVAALCMGIVVPMRAQRVPAGDDMRARDALVGQVRALVSTDPDAKEQGRETLLAATQRDRVSAIVNAIALGSPGGSYAWGAFGECEELLLARPAGLPDALIDFLQSSPREQCAVVAIGLLGSLRVRGERVVRTLAAVAGSGRDVVAAQAVWALSRIGYDPALLAKFAERGVTSSMPLLAVRSAVAAIERGMPASRVAAPLARVLGSSRVEERMYVLSAMLGPGRQHVWSPLYLIPTTAKPSDVVREQLRESLMHWVPASPCACEIDFLSDVARADAVARSEALECVARAPFPEVPLSELRDWSEASRAVGQEGLSEDQLREYELRYAKWSDERRVILAEIAVAAESEGLYFLERLARNRDIGNVLTGLLADPQGVDKGLRSLLVRGLEYSRQPSDRSIEALLREMRSRGSPDSENAAMALAAFAGQAHRFVGALLDKIHSTSAGLWITQWIGQVQDECCKEILESLAAPDPKIRAASAVLLGWLGNRESPSGIQAALVNATRDYSETVRMRAWESLARSWSSSRGDALEALVNDMQAHFASGTPMRIEIALVLRGLGSRAAPIAKRLREIHVPKGDLDGRSILDEVIKAIGDT